MMHTFNFKRINLSLDQGFKRLSFSHPLLTFLLVFAGLPMAALGVVALCTAVLAGPVVLAMGLL